MTLPALAAAHGWPIWTSDDGSQTLINADCLDVLKHIEPGTVDLTIADPPYGCDKAEWDSEFAAAWYPLCKPFGPVYVITGGAGIKDAVNAVSADFVDCIAARNMNSRTRSAVGFSNWHSVVVANGKPARPIPNAFDFCVTGDMPDHPSPKPIEFMLKLVQYISDEGQTILDPMAGSATTLVACVRAGRRGIGIELDRKYWEVACKRVAKECELKQGTGPIFKSLLEKT